MKIKTKTKWVVLAEAGRDKWGSVMVRARCACGNERVTRLSDIKSQKSLQCRDCGYKLKRNGVPVLTSPLCGKGNNFRHGQTGSPTYGVWCGMISRCRETKGRNYKWYGSRGITVCTAWLTFENFLKDMGAKKPGQYIDRIDNDKGYFKANCRWVNASVNSQNRRCVKKFKFR